MKAFRRYLRLRIHVHPLLQEYPPENLAALVLFEQPLYSCALFANVIGWALESWMFRSPMLLLHKNLPRSVCWSFFLVGCSKRSMLYSKLYNCLKSFRTNVEGPRNLFPRKPVVIAVHPHGVASDYRILLDGMFYNALPKREVENVNAKWCKNKTKPPSSARSQCFGC